MVIIGSKTGQLANRLFTFSHFIANSIEYKYTLYNPAFDEYRGYFCSSLNGEFGQRRIYLDLDYPVAVSLLHKIIKIGSKLFPSSKYHRIISCADSVESVNLNDINFVKDAQNKMVITDGWKFRDEHNFRKHAGILRSLFMPTRDILNNVQNRISKCRENGDILIGVHIRKGDYKEWRNGIYYYSNVTYREKMKELEVIFSEQGKTATFMLCSNEAINKEDFRDLSIDTGSVHMVEDLYALSECDYIIGPPSTFSMWASFYGQVPLLHIKDSMQVMNAREFTVCVGSIPL